MPGSTPRRRIVDCVCLLLARFVIKVCAGTLMFLPVHFLTMLAAVIRATTQALHNFDTGSSVYRSPLWIVALHNFASHVFPPEEMIATILRSRQLIQFLAARLYTNRLTCCFTGTLKYCLTKRCCVQLFLA